VLVPQGLRGRVIIQSLVTLSVFSLLGAACAAGNDDQPSGGSTSSSGGEPSNGGSDTGGMGGGFVEGGGGNGGGISGTPEVFGHSSTQLYKLNPETKAVGVVGTLQDCEEVVDLALDKDSNLFATTDIGLFSVNKLTGQCTLISAGAYPNSLSFVPAGTLDPDEEALVGFLDDQYVRIDVETGDILNIGAPWNNTFVSSGDVVSVKNGPTYLTIKDADQSDNVCGTDAPNGDCLVEINPTSGAIIEEFGGIGYDRVFGTAFWAGSVYGFTSEGEIFEILIENGELQTVLLEAEPGLSFWGAGSTTSAPPVPE